VHWLNQTRIKMLHTSILSFISPHVYQLIKLNGNVRILGPLSIQFYNASIKRTLYDLCIGFPIIKLFILSLYNNISSLCRFNLVKSVCDLFKIFVSNLAQFRQGSTISSNITNTIYIIFCGNYEFPKDFCLFNHLFLFLIESKIHYWKLFIYCMPPC